MICRSRGDSKITLYAGQVEQQRSVYETENGAGLWRKAKQSVVTSCPYPEQLIDPQNSGPEASEDGESYTIMMPHRCVMT